MEYKNEEMSVESMYKRACSAADRASLKVFHDLDGAYEIHDKWDKLIFSSNYVFHLVIWLEGCEFGHQSGVHPNDP